MRSRCAAGVVSTPPHDLAGVFRSFCASSFLTEPEGIAAALAVRDECLRVSSARVLRTKHGGSLSYEAFSSLQSETLEEALQALKDDWPQKTGTHPLILPPYHETLVGGDGWPGLYLHHAPELA